MSYGCEHLRQESSSLHFLHEIIPDLVLQAVVEKISKELAIVFESLKGDVFSDVVSSIGHGRRQKETWRTRKKGEKLEEREVLLLLHRCVF